jgi:mannose-6-phosphate isomerase-like protein (cupin superfamily)
MAELEKTVRHIKDIPVKKISNGVEERVLISPTAVGSEHALVKHYSLQTNAKLEYEHTSEAVFYFMSGEGKATVTLAARYPYTSDIILEQYSAFWVPPHRKGTILNSGEGPLRCLMASTTEQLEKVDVGPSLRNPTVSSRAECWRYPLMKTFGLEHKMLFRERPFSYLGRMISTEFQRYPSRSVQLRHHHVDAEQNVYVTRGYGKWMIGDKEINATPGTVIHIPKLIPHSAVAGEDDFMDFFVMMVRVEP